MRSRALLFSRRWLASIISCAPPWRMSRSGSEDAALGLSADACSRFAAATMRALIDNLVECELDPAAARLFIVDGSKALSKAIRAAFARDAAIQRRQIHKARNIMGRLPKAMHAHVRCVLRQAFRDRRR